jgi:hypothetical protein
MRGSVRIAIATEKKLRTTSSSASNSFTANKCNAAIGTLKEKNKRFGEYFPRSGPLFISLLSRTNDCLDRCAVHMLYYRIVSTCIFSPYVTIMNTLVGTKRLCNVIPTSLTSLKKAWHSSGRKQSKQRSQQSMVFRKQV